MPDVDDAVKVVTDPRNVVRSDAHTGERQINAKRAVRALRDMGAGRAEARELVTEAVVKLEGRVESEVQAQGRRSGPDKRTSADVWFIPAESVRE